MDLPNFMILVSSLVYRDPGSVAVDTYTEVD
jgi:hypothetical protein